MGADNADEGTAGRYQRVRGRGRGSRGSAADRQSGRARRVRDDDSFDDDFDDSDEERSGRRVRVRYSYVRLLTVCTIMYGMYSRVRGHSDFGYFMWCCM